MFRSIARLAIAASIGACAVPAVADAAAFGSKSIWSAPLRADAPLASNSAQLASGIASQVAAYGPWMNTTQYSAPVYTVASSQPRVRVTLDKYCPPLTRDLAAVPLPDNAVPARGSDKHLIVYQPSTGTMWEFWGLSKQADGWHTAWGGKMTSLASHAGYFPDHMGASASSLPLLGGLMRISELTSRSINHAIDVGLPDVTAGGYAWPAQRTDGASAAAGAVPEGTRFRLPANLDLNQFPMTPAVRAIAVAVQKYGMIVRDRTYSAVTLYGEDPTPTGSNPYGSIFGSGYFDKLLAAFPWAQLQAVAPTTDVFSTVVPATVPTTVPAPATATPRGAARPTVSKPTASKPATSKPTTPAKTAPTKAATPTPEQRNSRVDGGSVTAAPGAIVGTGQQTSTPPAREPATSGTKRTPGYKRCVAKARKIRGKRARATRLAACARAGRRTR